MKLIFLVQWIKKFFKKRTVEEQTIIKEKIQLDSIKNIDLDIIEYTTNFDKIGNTFSIKDDNIDAAVSLLKKVK
jgi:hypothetical protein